MGVFSKISNGLAKSRDKFKDSMYDLIGRGPGLDEGFWEGLEETLILSDMGGQAAMRIVDNLRSESKRLNLPDSYAVLDLLSDQIISAFAKGGQDVLGPDKQVVLFVGINGTGKTTTVGKIAKAQTEAGRNVILGSADTFRAAAIEQLSVWANRANVEMVTRERGSDPASVCFETIERAEKIGADLVLIDTAGRLHTSDDLMRELVKVVNVTRKRAEKSDMKVFTVLVIDATTGQNGMQQAREFDKDLDLDALIVTKLDGTAKGGIALAISSELDLPIIKIGVGEGIDDLRQFNASEYVAALIGDFEEDEILEDEVSFDVEEEVSAESSAEPKEDLEAGDSENLLEDVPIAESSRDESEVAADAHEGEADPDKSASETSSNINEAEMTNTNEGDTLPKPTEEDSQEESRPMTWAEFVEYDEAQKAKKPKKKHFWEKW